FRPPPPATGPRAPGEGEPRPAEAALGRADLDEARLGEEPFDLFHGAKRIHGGGQRGESLLVAGPISEEHAAAGSQHTADLAEVGHGLVPEVDDVGGGGGSEGARGG